MSRKLLSLLMLLMQAGALFSQSAEEQALQQQLSRVLGSNHGFEIRCKNSHANLKGATSDAFVWQCAGKKVELYAQNAEARMHALNNLLEQMCGLLLLAPDAFTFNYAVPYNGIDSVWQSREKQMRAKAMQIREKGFSKRTYTGIPDFAYRELYMANPRNTSYKQFYGLSGDTVNAHYKHPGWGLWVHTLHTLLPPDVWFGSNPEYYALRNGIRMQDQVCMSSEGALQHVIEELGKRMQEQPEQLYWSVSQMDNYNYCECDACAKTDAEEGSHAGSLLRFVNAVARAFPHKIISTLAYQYTRQATLHTKPEPNVNIMLCSIESDRSKPIQGTSFEDDLKAWSRLTHEIIIWDYVVNFSHLLAPFPNWKSLPANLQLFKQYGVKMLFEQGFPLPGTEMQDLRTWLLAKLMWNSSLPADSLTKVYLQHYYGSAWNTVYTLLAEQVQQLDLSGKALTLYEPPATHIQGYLKPQNIQRWLYMLEQAKAQCATEPLLISRLEQAEQPLRYAALECFKTAQAGKDYFFLGSQNPAQIRCEATGGSYGNMLEDFANFCVLGKTAMLSEKGYTIESYLNQTRQYWERAQCRHLAVNKRVHYEIAPDAAYRAGSVICDTCFWQSNQAINNGIRADKYYQYNWMGWWGNSASIIIDLDTPQTVNRVNIQFLENNMAWIVGPGYLRIQAVNLNARNEISMVTDSIFIANSNAGRQMPEDVYSLEARFTRPVTTRFLRIEIKNPGKLPAWRGVNNNGWLFADEIEVY